jgi:hypothetical protein
MARPRTPPWTPVPLKLVDQDVYGRTERAYRNRQGFMLVEHKPLSPRRKEYRGIGVWLLCDGLVVIARKGYYGIRPKRPPLGWAKKRIKLRRLGLKP